MSNLVSNFIWGTTPTSPVELPKKAAAIKGEVYINDTNLSQIRQDRRYEFSKRLRDEKGDQILIEEDDLYLSLDGKIETVGTFSNQPFWFRSKTGCNWNHLPASLFANVKEGGVVRFYWEDQLVELTCRQRISPNFGSFEGTLIGMKGLQHHSFLR